MEEVDWGKYKKSAQPDFSKYKKVPQNMEQPQEQQNPFMSGLNNFNNSMSAIPQALWQSGVFGDELAKGSRQFGQQQQQLAQEGMQQNPIASMLGQNIGESAPWALAALAGGPGALGAAARGIGAAGRGVGGAVRGIPAAILSRFGDKTGTGLENIIRNYEVSQGTGTPLGRVLESPGLANAHENIATPIPFSGGKAQLESTAEQLVGQGENLLSNLAGKHAGKDIDQVLRESLIGAQKNQNKIKNDLYKPVNELAQKEGFKLELPKTENLLKENIDAIKESPLYKTNSKFKSAVNKMVGLREKSETSPILNAKGEVIKTKMHPSIVEARVIAGDLYDAAQTMMRNPNSADQAIGKLFSKISKSMREETQHGIQTKGSENLRKADVLANANYKKNYAPFLDKDIHKLLKNENLVDAFSRTIIRPGKAADRHQRIEKIQKLLPKEDRDLLGYTVLQKALGKNGELNPAQLSSVIGSIGPRQMKALFPENATRKSIEDYATLTKLNPEALNVMFNPKTGARVSPLIAAALSGGVGFGPSGLATFGAQAGAARGFNKMMTSEKMRAEVLKKIIEKAAKQNRKKEKGIDKMLEEAKK